MVEADVGGQQGRRSAHTSMVQVFGLVLSTR